MLFVIFANFCLIFCLWFFRETDGRFWFAKNHGFSSTIFFGKFTSIFFKYFTFCDENIVHLIKDWCIPRFCLSLLSEKSQKIWLKFDFISSNFDGILFCFSGPQFLSMIRWKRQQKSWNWQVNYFPEFFEHFLFLNDEITNQFCYWKAMTTTFSTALWSLLFNENREFSVWRLFSSVFIFFQVLSDDLWTRWMETCWNNR